MKHFKHANFTIIAKEEIIEIRLFMLIDYPNTLEFNIFLIYNSGSPYVSSNLNYSDVFQRKLLIYGIDMKDLENIQAHSKIDELLSHNKTKVNI